LIAILIVFQFGFTYFTPVQTFFGIVAIDAKVWRHILLVSSSVMFLVELDKLIT